MSTEITRQSNAPQTFNFFDADQFATMQRVCTMFSSSELVPDMYRASDKNPLNKAIANCMIAIETAQRIGASPLMVMQNMYIVYGKPSWSAKFLTATVNACGRFKSLKYKMELKGKVKFGEQQIDNWECIAYTTEKGSDEVLESVPVDIQMAISEGWYGKNGSKWKTMPKLMLQYRCVTYWTSAYAPELSMGIKTTEEIMDIEDIPFEDVSNQVKAEIKDNAHTQSMTFEDEPGVKETQSGNDPVHVNSSAESNPDALTNKEEAKKSPGF